MCQELLDKQQWFQPIPIGLWIKYKFAKPYWQHITSTRKSTLPDIALHISTLHAARKVFVANESNHKIKLALQKNIRKAENSNNNTDSILNCVRSTTENEEISDSKILPPPQNEEQPHHSEILPIPQNEENSCNNLKLQKILIKI